MLGSVIVTGARGVNDVARASARLVAGRRLRTSQTSFTARQVRTLAESTLYNNIFRTKDMGIDIDLFLDYVGWTDKWEGDILKGTG